MKVRTHLVLLVLATAAAGCTSAAPGPLDDPSEVASIQLELTMLPSDAACLQLTVTAGTQTTVRTLDIGVRGRSVVSLEGLPTGSATLSGVAYAVPCTELEGATPTWSADAVTATLSSGAVTTVVLTFQRGGRVRLNADFPIDTPWVKQVAVGQTNTCAILRDGTLRCWGTRFRGHIGDGVDGPFDSGFQLRPTIVSREKYLQVVVGAVQACGLLADGTVRCWGEGTLGELGNGSFEDKLFPTPILDFSGVTQLAAGTNHVCALVSGGAVFCWGADSSGQLGDGAQGSFSTSPGLVSNLSSRVVQIATGSAASYAVTVDGLVHSWGSNAFGQLGDGTTTNRSTPAPIPGLTNVVQVAGGFAHACARLADGTVKCWGDNSIGQIGDGTFMNQRLTPTVVAGLTNVTGLMLLSSSTIVARADGSARAWGRNTVGELADGTTTFRLTPVTVSGLTSLDQLAIAGASEHGCAIIAEGNLRCWGDNSRGAVGDGTTVNKTTPVAPLF